MFREYYGMPEATAEKFTDGWYETGDLVRFGADGYLRILYSNDTGTQIEICIRDLTEETGEQEKKPWKSES